MRRRAPAPARLPQLRGGRGRGSARGSTVVARAQRRRQDEPPRGALLRLHRGARAARTNEREVVRFGAGAGARWSSRSQARRDGEHELSVGFQPGEAKRFTGRRRAGRAPAGRAAPPARRASSCPTASSWSRARRRCAARTSTRSSPRCGPARAAHPPRVRAGARAAQRAAGARPRRRPRSRARCRRGTSSSRATASR